MTYAELLAKVTELVPNESVCIGVETWRHAENGVARPGVPETDWKITVFDGTSVRCSVRGVSPERALANLHVEIDGPVGTTGVDGVVIDTPVPEPTTAAALENF